jgi:hypothetical protein
MAGAVPCDGYAATSRRGDGAFQRGCRRAVRLRLTITFADKETDVPIENADIRLGPFRATTDAGGRAELWIPAGQYEVNVWHRSYEAPPTTLNVNGERVLRLQGITVPEEDPSARWMM